MSARYFEWVDNMHDWCISRQLWWGHRIPVFYGPNDEVVVCGPDETPPVGYTQDPDVLDTWFSSALWPFSTLGWPNQTEDLKKFYPTSVLVTGYDILFFWLSGRQYHISILDYIFRSFFWICSSICHFVHLATGVL